MIWFRFFAVFCLLGALAGPALAEGPLSVRTGDHDKYSRIVFEWKKLSGYGVEKTDAKTITVKFSEAAELPKETVEAFNIVGFNVTSSNPFTAVLTVPEQSEFRYFAAGERLIVDIYDSPARARPKPEAPPPAAAGHEEKPGEEAEKKKPTDEPELGKIIKPDTVPVEPKKPEPVKAPEKVEQKAEAVKPQPAKAEPAPESAEAKPHQPALIPKPNLISISATKPYGLAAFESGGKIVMVIDEPGILVKPQVSGENATLIEPVENFTFEGGKGFTVASLAGTKVRAEGGSLLWSLVVTPEMDGLENASLERREGKVFVPLKNIRKAFKLADPQTGVMLDVVTAGDSESRVGDAVIFIDFEILPSAAGLAVRPKSDGVEVKIVPEGVEISKEGGLSLTPADQVEMAAAAETKRLEAEEMAGEVQEPVNGQVLFDFKQWRMGGLETLNQNRNILFAAMHGKTREEQVAELIRLAQMHISNGRAAEGLGFLRFASQELPELEQNPEFLALRAVSKAFDGKLETALEDLDSPLLAEFGETQIWKAYVLAGLGDWAQAAETLPGDYTVLRNYTPEVLNRLALVLAEIALRDGNIEMAEELFKLIEAGKAEDDLNKAIDAQMSYLRGEAARQKGKTDETVKLWEPLTKGPDDLYRVKSGLSLARLLIDEKKLKPKDVIDRLERLRYAWRGDELEAQVNYWLGRTYFEAGETIKGLKILRDSIPVAKGTPLAPKVAQDMTKLYTDYFTGPSLEKENPMNAMALYEEFRELLPAGEEGNRVIKALAERLVKADLLARGAKLLQYQIDHRLQGDPAARTAVRLAAIYLLDKTPDQALKALDKARSILQTLPPELATAERVREIELLRARALSQAKRPDQALAVLAAMDQGPDVNRLRADIAWNAGYWDDASYALQDVMNDEEITLTRPLSVDHAEIILQRALALNLSGDRVGLTNMRETYTEAMSQTPKAKQFEVVTRPRQSAGLADRETLLSAVSEVDLFKGFLESYKKDIPPSN